MNRWHRHLSLLQAIDMEPDFKRHPDEYSSSKMRDRPLRKVELQRICEILGVRHDGTVPELRDRLREEYMDDLWYGSFRDQRDTKQPTSEFSTKELRRLKLEIENEQRLDADDVDVWDDVAKWGGSLTINGVDYEVTEKSRGSWSDAWGEPAYDVIETYYLTNENIRSRRLRLAVIRGKTDKCRYRHSVALERAKGYGPYKKWSHDRWVESINT